MSLGWYYTGGGSSTGKLGGLISSTALAETDGALFADVTQANALAGLTEYACICIKNTGVATINNAEVYLSSVVTDANIYIAKGLTGKNSTTEQTIANSTTPPTGALVFQKPLFSYAAMALGTLAAGEFYHIWLKREVRANAKGSPNDYFILSGVEG